MKFTIGECKLLANRGKDGASFEENIDVGCKEQALKLGIPF